MHNKHKRADRNPSRMWTQLYKLFNSKFRKGSHHTRVKQVQSFRVQLKNILKSQLASTMCQQPKIKSGINTNYCDTKQNAMVHLCTQRLCAASHELLSTESDKATLFRVETWWRPLLRWGQKIYHSVEEPWQEVHPKQHSGLQHLALLGNLYTSMAAMYVYTLTAAWKMWHCMIHMWYLWLFYMSQHDQNAYHKWQNGSTKFHNPEQLAINDVHAQQNDAAQEEFFTTE